MAEKRSSMKKKREQQRKKAARARRVRRSLLVFTEFLLVCALSVCCYGVSILNTMQRSTINQKDIYIATFANEENNQKEETQPAAETSDNGEMQTNIAVVHARFIHCKCYSAVVSEFERISEYVYKYLTKL